MRKTTDSVLLYANSEANSMGGIYFLKKFFSLRSDLRAKTQSVINFKNNHYHQFSLVMFLYSLVNAIIRDILEDSTMVLGADGNNHMLIIVFYIIMLILLPYSFVDYRSVFT